MTVKRIGLFLLLITTGMCFEKWFRINSTCFQVNENDVEQNIAIELCQQKGSNLLSIQSKAELDSLAHYLTRGYYRASAKRTQSGFQWLDGRNCCPNDWLEPGEPNSNDNCIALHKTDTTTLLTGILCVGQAFGFICSKPVVYRWILMNWEEYNWPDLCGVEIMANLDGQSCDKVCDSRPDCKQFAKLSNSCINIKNDAPLDKCIVRMRPNVQLYKRELYCEENENIFSFKHSVIEL